MGIDGDWWPAFPESVLMTEGKGHSLNDLTIWKLKAVASEHDIDVSDCRYKKDFVERITARELTDAQIQAALEKAQKDGAQATKAEEEVAAIGMDAEAIASRTAGPKEIPEAEDREVERYIDQTMTSRPSFFEVEAAVENAYGKMVLGDYADAVKAVREARTRGLEALSYLNVYSSAVSIRAAEELLAHLAQESGAIDANLKTALAAAKRSFIAGSPRQREETLADLETLTLKAHDAAVTHAVEAEEELRRALLEYESFGTYTLPAKQLLDVAAQARQALNFKDHSRFVNSARTEADKAREARVREISYGLKIAAAATMEAKGAGVETSSLETKLTDARKAFDGGAFARSLELYSAVERAADAAHAEKIRGLAESSDQKLREIAAELSSLEAVLSEAASLGVATTEGVFYAGNAKSALSKRDPVAASKFTRLARDFTASNQKEIDRKRVEAGKATLIEGAKCGRCGKVSLYLHPDGSRRCGDCGHSFTVAPSAAGPGAESEPEPKETKRRLLKRDKKA
jgi:hypothetical protein